MFVVIFSAKPSSRGKPWCLGSTSLFGLLAILPLSLLGLGAWLGFQLRAASQPTPPLPHDTAQLEALLQQQEALTTYLSTISTQVLQLEAKAQQLTTRMQDITGFAQRMQQEDALPSSGVFAKTQPGTGGPFIPSSSVPKTNTARSTIAPTEKTAPHATSSANASVAFAVPPSVGPALQNLEQHRQRLAQLFEQLEQQTDALHLAYLAFPMRTPVKGARLSSPFGQRKDPFHGHAAFHSGMDFAAPPGSPIYASGGGQVIFVGNRKDYGKTVEIDHGAGLVTRYAHASAILVKTRQVVLPGQMIAKIGSSGRSTGPHLHFEVLKDGYYMDPALYLARF